MFGKKVGQFNNNRRMVQGSDKMQIKLKNDTSLIKCKDVTQTVCVFLVISRGFLYLKNEAWP